MWFGSGPGRSGLGGGGPGEVVRVGAVRVGALRVEQVRVGAKMSLFFSSSRPLFVLFMQNLRVFR